MHILEKNDELSTVGTNQVYRQSHILWYKALQWSKWYIFHHEKQTFLVLTHSTQSLLIFELIFGKKFEISP